MQHKIVITRHRPWLRKLLVVGSVVALVVGAGVIFGVTRHYTISNYAEAKSEVSELRDERRELSRQVREASAQIKDLQAQLVYAERSKEIEANACTDVRNSLSSLQTEVADLNEQVAFYRGIVSPDEARAGLRVMEMRVRPAESAGVWTLEGVLIQSVRQDKRLAGKVQIELVGLRGTQSQRVDLSTLLVSGNSLPGFAFKYFQEFAVSFRMPQDGFRPLRLTVTLVPDSSAQSRVVNDFDWARIQATQETPP